MRKTTLLIWLFIFASISINSQNVYNENDKETLREILRQKGTAYNSSYQTYQTDNFRLYNLAENDTLNWYNDEGWVETVTDLNNSLSWVKYKMIWDESSPKKIQSLVWLWGVESTKFKLSEFKELTSFYIAMEKYSPYKNKAIVDISDCQKLSEVSGNKIQFTDNSFLVDNKIQSVRLTDSSGAFIFSKSPDLEIASISTAFLGNGTTNYDFSLNPNIKEVYIHNFAIEKIELAGASKLERFTYSSNQISDVIKQIDLADCVNLKNLSLGGYLSGIKSLDLSNCTKLDSVRLIALSALNEDVVWGNINPTYLYISSCEIPSRTLDLSKMTKLTELTCSYNNVREIVYPNPDLLTSVNVFGNSFLFSKLPLNTYSTFRYDQQSLRDTIYAPGYLDLSNEFEIDGQPTEFEWDLESITPIDLIGSDGVFEIPSDYANKRITCLMTNPRFPGLKIYYGLNVLPKNTTGLDPDLTELENGIKIDRYNINKGEPIVITTSATGQALLYNINGQLLSKSKLAEGETQISIDAAGIFIINIQLDSGTYKTYKVVAK